MTGGTEQTDGGAVLEDLNTRSEDNESKEYRAVCACGAKGLWYKKRPLAVESQGVLNGATPPTGGEKEPCCTENQAEIEVRSVDTETAQDGGRDE